MAPSDYNPNICTVIVSQSVSQEGELKEGWKDGWRSNKVKSSQTIYRTRLLVAKGTVAQNPPHRPPQVQTTVLDWY